MKELGGVLMFVGFFFAASDGDWFPVANFVALGVMYIGYRLIIRKPKRRFKKIR